MNSYKKISSISIDDKKTWNDTIFLTFDIDWAHDVILSYAIDMIEDAGIEATWFVTHDTPLLKRLRNNPKFELGIHPNFNFLLEGDDRNGKNAKEVIERLLELVPEAKSVRSHHMTQSSHLLQLFKNFGITHDVNQFIPNSLGLSLCPWALWNGLIRVPYIWEDDIHILYKSHLSQSEPSESVLSDIGIKVFDFHPIHIFLNTESLHRYELTRNIHQNPKELINYRFKGYGTRTILTNLLKLNQ